MQTYLADLCLRCVFHVLKKLLCPVYEGLYVHTVIPLDPPATQTVATEAALQPL